MTVKTKYDFGEIVVLRHDPDRLLRMVTGVTIWPGSVIRYCLQFGGNEVWAFEMEVTAPVNRKRQVGFVK